MIVYVIPRNRIKSISVLELRISDLADSNDSPLRSTARVVISIIHLSLSFV